MANLYEPQLIISVKEARKILGKKLSDKLSDNQVRVIVESLTTVSGMSIKSARVPKNTKV